MSSGGAPQLGTMPMVVNSVDAFRLCRGSVDSFSSFHRREIGAHDHPGAVRTDNSHLITPTNNNAGEANMWNSAVYTFARNVNGGSAPRIESLSVEGLNDVNKRPPQHAGPITGSGVDVPVADISKDGWSAVARGSGGSAGESPTAPAKTSKGLAPSVHDSGAGPAHQPARYSVSSNTPFRLSMPRATLLHDGVVGEALSGAKEDTVIQIMPTWSESTMMKATSTPSRYPPKALDVSAISLPDPNSSTVPRHTQPPPMAEGTPGDSQRTSYASTRSSSAGKRDASTETRPSASVTTATAAAGRAPRAPQPHKQQQEVQAASQPINSRRAVSAGVPLRVENAIPTHRPVAAPAETTANERIQRVPLYPSKEPDADRQTASQPPANHNSQQQPQRYFSKPNTTPSAAEWVPSDNEGAPTIQVSTTTITASERKVRYLHLDEAFDPDAPDPTDVDGQMHPQDRAMLLHPAEFAEAIASQNAAQMLTQDGGDKASLTVPTTPGAASADDGSGVPVYLMNNGRRWVRRSNRPAVSTTAEPHGRRRSVPSLPLPTPPSNPSVDRPGAMTTTAGSALHQRRDSREYVSFPAHQVVNPQSGKPTNGYLLQRHMQQMVTDGLLLKAAPRQFRPPSAAPRRRQVAPPALQHDHQKSPPAAMSRPPLSPAAMLSSSSSPPMTHSSRTPTITNSNGANRSVLDSARGSTPRSLSSGTDSAPYQRQQSPRVATTTSTTIRAGVLEQLPGLYERYTAPPPGQAQRRTQSGLYTPPAAAPIPMSRQTRRYPTSEGPTPTDHPARRPPTQTVGVRAVPLPAQRRHELSSSSARSSSSESTSRSLPCRGAASPCHAPHASPRPSLQELESSPPGSRNTQSSRSERGIHVEPSSAAGSPSQREMVSGMVPSTVARGRRDQGAGSLSTTSNRTPISPEYINGESYSNGEYTYGNGTASALFTPDNRGHPDFLIARGMHDGQEPAPSDDGYHEDYPIHHSSTVPGFADTDYTPPERAMPDHYPHPYHQQQQGGEEPESAAEYELESDLLDDATAPAEIPSQRTEDYDPPTLVKNNSPEQFIVDGVLYVDDGPAADVDGTEDGLREGEDDATDADLEELYYESEEEPQHGGRSPALP